MKYLKIFVTAFMAGSFISVAANAETIRFWTTENQPKRLAKQEAMAADFQKRTGLNGKIIDIEDKISNTGLWSSHPNWKELRNETAPCLPRNLPFT